MILFLSCERREFSRTEFALGTVSTVTLYEQGIARIYNEIFSRIRKIENLMSVNLPGSDVSRINAAAGIEPVAVHKDTFNVIETAVFFAELSQGAFDPTIGPLVSLWGFGTENQRVPSVEEIENVLPLINWRNVELDSSANSVFLTQPGMALDLGAIAKGFAADAAADIARNSGIEAAIIDLGGDIVVHGIKSDRTPWRIGIQNPEKERRTIVGVLQLLDQRASIVTSGIYERFFEVDGIRYHHLFSPFTGFPANTGLLSVTIIGGNAMQADALSTAAFVLGYERGITLVEYFAAEAIFVFEDRRVVTTPGLNFTLTDNSFLLIN